MSVALAAPASADEAAAALARSHLEAGTLDAGATALEALIAADPANDEAHMGLGMVRFMQAIENLAQGLYRYGLAPPDGGFLLPVVRLPVPPNPNPEPITYEAFRDLLKGLVTDMAASEAAFAAVGDGEAKVPVDFLKVGYDANADGTVAPAESLFALMMRMSPMGGDGIPDGDDPAFIITFDRADSFWFRGYTHVISGVAEFWLAYDWHEAFDATFHLFFPRSDLPMGRELAKSPTFGPDDRIADLVNFIHLMHWPVAEPERAKAAGDHFRAVFDLSRQNWDAIERETDDDHEWVPSPVQTAAIGVPVTAEQVAAWRSVIVQAEAVFDGRRLVPHWRLERGFNLGRVFSEPTTFDLVLWITGPAALPYLEDGNVLTSEEWNALTAAFQGNFAGYMFWFN